MNHYYGISDIFITDGFFARSHLDIIAKLADFYITHLRELNLVARPPEMLGEPAVVTLSDQQYLEQLEPLKLISEDCGDINILLELFPDGEDYTQLFDEVSVPPQEALSTCAPKPPPNPSPNPPSREKLSLYPPEPLPDSSQQPPPQKMFWSSLPRPPSGPPQKPPRKKLSASLPRPHSGPPEKPPRRKLSASLKRPPSGPPAAAHNAALSMPLLQQPEREVQVHQISSNVLKDSPAPYSDDGKYVLCSTSETSSEREFFPAKRSRPSVSSERKKRGNRAPEKSDTGSYCVLLRRLPADHPAVLKYTARFGVNCAFPRKEIAPDRAPAAKSAPQRCEKIPTKKSKTEPNRANYNFLSTYKIPKKSKIITAPPKTGRWYCRAKTETVDTKANIAPVVIKKSANIDAEPPKKSITEVVSPLCAKVPDHAATNVAQKSGSNSRDGQKTPFKRVSAPTREGTFLNRSNQQKPPVKKVSIPIQKIRTVGSSNQQKTRKDIAALAEKIRPSSSNLQNRPPAVPQKTLSEPFDQQMALHVNDEVTPFDKPLLKKLNQIVEEKIRVRAEPESVPKFCILDETDIIRLMKQAITETLSSITLQSVLRPKPNRNKSSSVRFSDTPDVFFIEGRSTEELERVSFYSKTNKIPVMEYEFVIERTIRCVLKWNPRWLEVSH